MPRLSPADREAFWRKLVAQQRSSNRTVEQVCRQAGVSPASFYAWRQRLKGRSASLVPVRIVESADDGRTAILTRDVDGREYGQVAADGHDPGELIVELGDVLPSQTPAVRVRIPASCDEESIGRVLHAVLTVLRKGPTC